MNFKASLLKNLSGALLIAAVAFAISYGSGDPGTLLLSLSTPHSGEREVLPPEALFVLDFTRQHGVKSVTMSKLISENRFLAQPITESIYPAVVKDMGELYVFSAAEPLPAGCATLKTQKGIRLASCR
ncbi:MAG TPA: hypothetical protein DCZ75_03770 [Geobacter sp.]|nr:hypothetical protein [Geobacter sp.]